MGSTEGKCVIVPCPALCFGAELGSDLRFCIDIIYVYRYHIGTYHSNACTSTSPKIERSKSTIVQATKIEAAGS